jgi:hypothetical protein
MSLNFDVNSNLSLVRKFHSVVYVSHYRKIVKMCQFYSDSSRFFCNQLYNWRELICNNVKQLR